MNVRQGLKAFGYAGFYAVMTKIREVHNQGAIKAVRRETLAFQHKKDALCYLMLGQVCADSWKERLYIKKDTPLPTEYSKQCSSPQWLMLQSAFNFATVDYTGAFSQLDLENDLILLQIDGKMADFNGMIYSPKFQRSIDASQRTTTIFA